MIIDSLPSHSAAMGYGIRPGTSRPIATVVSRGQRVRCRVSHIAFDRIELVPHDLGLEDAPTHVELQLADSMQPIPGTLSKSYDDANEVIGATFQPSQLSRAEARKLLLFISRLELETSQSLVPSATSHSESVTDPERVSTVLRALVSNGSQTILRASGQDWILRPEQVELDRMHWRIEARGGLPTSPLVLEAAGYSGVYKLPVLVVHESAERLVTTIPRRIVRDRQRRMPRGKPQRAYRASFEHPLWPGFEVNAEVCDLAHGGLGIAFDPLEHLLHPGLELAEIRLTLDGETVATFQGSVRTAPPAIDCADLACGLRVEPKTALDARVWRRIVAEELHEETLDFPDDPAPLWNLLDEAGYLARCGKLSSDRERLRSAFLLSSKKLRMAPEIACQIVWPGLDGGLVASVSQLKTYSGSWLGCHMAKVQGKSFDGVPGRRILRDIHLHSIEHLLADQSMRWFMSYIMDEGARFSKLALLQFVERIDDEKNACMVPFTALAISTEQSADASDAEVHKATEADEAVFLTSVLECRPEAYCKAYDYTRAELHLRTVREGWQTAGLAREREILIAKVAGVSVAAAVLEFAADGVHLFGTLDSAKLFPLVPGGEKHFDALLRAAAAWFRSMGKSQFFFFDEWKHEAVTSLKYDEAGSGICAIIGDKLMPDYLDHFFEWMAWAPPGHSQFPPALELVPAPHQTMSLSHDEAC